MISKLPSSSQRVLVVSFSGQVNSDDYEKVLIPEIEEQAAKGPICLTIVMDDKLEGFSFENTLKDFRLGLHHWEDFSRLAIVSDNIFVRSGAHLLSTFLSFEMKLFHQNERHAAIDWAGQEAVKPMHRLIKKAGVLVLKPRGSIDKGQIALLKIEVDDYLKNHHALKGVLIETTHFPDWQNVEALRSHFNFVKEHYNRIQRIALVTDDSKLGTLPLFADLFLKSEVRHFKANDKHIAKEWLANAL